ncbi:MAG: prepilin-type N-terminal cleavage/methylation domain-containing protein, partial [Gemmatimonadales bacterium]
RRGTRSRAGFTLAELIVATAIAGIAAAAMTMTLSRQQRFFASTSAILDVRGQIRDGADVLVSDIRSAAVARFGLPVMTDSAIEMFTTVATSVACSAPVGATIGLPPQILARGNTLTSILFLPDTGDIAMLYAASTIRDSSRWESARILSFASRAIASSCPASTGFTSAGDASAGSSGYMVTLAQPPTAAIREGAPIMFLRRVRYSLYRSSDGEWYLGYRRCNAATGVCAAIQPVSGPYRAYSASAGLSGLSLRYYDELGTELTSPSNAVARVDIAMRGQTSRPASLSGDSRTAYRDSIVVSVSPRNRQ